MNGFHMEYKRIGLAAIFMLLFLTGCTGSQDDLPEQQKPETAAVVSLPTAEIEDDLPIAETEEEASREEVGKPQIIEADWSEYFDGIHGAAVLYDPTENRYQIYGQELAETRRSPCSTFKIISSQTALEAGIIDPEHSVRPWSGEVFWNEQWNRDIDFDNAFRASCVWYFREVIDEIGKDRMEKELDRLSYGNCDISDWEGRLNTNNSNPALTGFWIESSLKISPKEQTEVMERIFGEGSDYSEETIDRLMEVMRLPEQTETDVTVYGKTGMGKAGGVVVDCWFTGFADHAGKRIYFCVYLGETENQEVSSAKAKEIALRIIPASYQQSQ